jgi:ABC-2 type transport system ATP-binding protein
MKSIIINNVSKKYGNFYALKNINLQIDEGKIFGLLGPNGAGKSTLMKILSTLISPSKGNVEILGLNLQKNFSKIRKMISLVSDYTVLEEDLTSYENLKMFSEMSGIKISKDFIKDIMEDFGLNLYKDRLVKKLSSGNKQKLNIARALLKKPKILLLDEPTNAIDVETSKFIREYIIHENIKSKVTIIISSHYIWEVEQLASDIAVIIDGEIKLLDKTENLYSQFNDIIKIYEITFEKENFDEIMASLKTQETIITTKPISENKIIIETKKEFEGNNENYYIREITPSLEDVYSYVVKNNG